MTMHEAIEAKLCRCATGCIESERLMEDTGCYDGDHRS
jgi:hypothetical protein